MEIRYAVVFGKARAGEAQARQGWCGYEGIGVGGGVAGVADGKHTS